MRLGRAAGGPAFLRAAALALTLALSACALPVAAPAPDGSLEVLGPEAGFPTAAGGGEWAFDGPRSARAAIGGAVVEGRSALAVGPGGGGFRLVRRMRVRLTASPFLDWQWHMDPPAGGPHPVTLVIGFRGGTAGGGSWGAQPLQWLSTALPPFERLLVVAWDASPFARGELATGIEGSRAAARYVARGGAATAAAWQRDAVDLASLYARAWPDDDASAAHVVFVGLAADPDRTATGRFARIALSR